MKHVPSLDIDDTPVNPSGNRHLNDIVASRRQVLQGGLKLALAGLFGTSLKGCGWSDSEAGLTGAGAPLLGFTRVPVQMDAAADHLVVAPGYTARAFFSWGDAVLAEAPPWQKDASNTWQDQELQAGQNHDGMAFFPMTTNSSDHGLLVINHEYANNTLHPHGPTVTHDEKGFALRPADEVKKEQAAHGLSVIEIKRDAQGQWQRVSGSRFNRRFTAYTPMSLSGPVAGTDWVKTQADPSGTQVLGTLNNCSMGVTPWGTYLACEENWHNYFVNRNPDDYRQRTSHRRYRLSPGKNSEYYYWESADPRFNATPDETAPHGGYVNEPHKFGWVVEIDPFNPQSTPKKRTALGRFARECATVATDEHGNMAIYSGDDTRGEYIYKFVPSTRFDTNNPGASRDALDKGTLYVAVFHDDGTGEWRPLLYGKNGLTAENGFSSQAEVLVNARAAADAVGATPMDRPEWIAVHPQSRDVYVTLTNNVERGMPGGDPVNAANPRAQNHHGQILRWQEEAANPAATEFTWDIFVLAGKPSSNDVPDNQEGTIHGDIFSSPDGLWFDKQGRLWIETDFDDDDPVYNAMGTNQLLCADPHTREIRRFLTGPRGCEITGLTSTPDGRSLWLNIQHPGLSYPASDGKTRPRSTTVLITKDDGGVIGT